MNTEKLEQLGLSRNEARVYQTLLQKGTANSAEISRESGVHRINVYDVLNSLISKGLVSYVADEGKRVFKAEDPHRFEELIAEKTAALETILPEMLSQFNSKKEPLDISILRGVEGKRSQFEEMTRLAHHTVHMTFIPHGFITLEKPPYNTVLRKFYEKISKQGTESKLLVLDTPDARKRAQLLAGIPKVKIGFSKEITFTAVSWAVCEDRLFLTFFIEPYLIIRIRSKEICHAFKNNFELMWKMAKK